MAQHFARGVPPIAIWEGIDVREGEGPPLVASDRLADGSRRAEVPAGEDTFFVGEVLSVEEGARDAAARLRRPGLRQRVIEAVVFDLDGVLLDSEQVWDEVREELVRSAAAAGTGRPSGR